MKSLFILISLIVLLFSSFVFSQGISSQTIGATNSIANSKALTTTVDSLQNIFSAQPSTFFRYWYTLTITTDADIEMSSSKDFVAIKTFTLKANESYTSIQRDAILFDDYYFKAVSTNANIRIILEGR
ncbi:MAG: hypothetical protein IT212_03740 [Bacteroidia bacterium]|nr:hypothetical protein [Bacteroidia bacterium]